MKPAGPQANMIGQTDTQTGLQPAADYMDVGGKVTASNLILWYDYSSGLHY